MHEPNPLHIPAEHGCILDQSIKYVDDQGDYWLVWTPELTEESIPRPEGLKLAEGCDIGGHKWDAPTVKEAFNFLIDHTVCNPYTRVPGAVSGWYHTKTDDVDPSDSGGAFFVDLSFGCVLWDSRSGSGRVRACRRVRPSQK